MASLADGFPLFVYGTLKRRGRYHDQFCASPISVEEATLRGRLYLLYEGYPALELPPELILAHGTEDPNADAAAARRFDVQGLSKTGTDWLKIQGELIVLPDPSHTVPPIDALEDFVPNRSQNLYLRVLTLVETAHGHHAAWTYIGSAPAIDSAQPLPEGWWPHDRTQLL